MMTVCIKNEEGSMLIVALMLLMVLTLIGISVTNTSRVEIQVAGNDRFHRVAFQLADSGIYATPKVISACMDQASEADLAGVTYLGTSGSFYRELMGFIPNDTDRDLRFVMSGYNVDIDVARLGQENIAGRGAEFASGSEGVGAGSLGGVGVVYEIDSMTSGPSSALADISAVYRNVVGLPGGL
jgi:PilX N-terminal